MPRLTNLCRLGLICLLCSLGCRQQRQVEQPRNVATYTVKGTVIEPMPRTGEVMLQHEAIPGFMGAMTMPYKLAEPNTLSELHQGDRITARLRVERDADGVSHNARIDQLVVTAQARPDYKPSTQFHVPAVGDAVPDFQLTDQDAHVMRLSEQRGKVVLITFIYTRCPLSDFCPRMTRNFLAIDAELRRSRRLHDATRLLSVSFDPAFDSPKVLRAYADSYIGRQNEDFAHWAFAAPEQGSLVKMQQFFNVGATQGAGSTIDHSLSTVLVDANGRVAAFYPGNEWKPEDVVARMRALSGA